MGDLQLDSNSSMKMSMEGPTLLRLKWHLMVCSHLVIADERFEDLSTTIFPSLLFGR